MSGNPKQTPTGGPQTQRYGTSYPTQNRAEGFPVSTQQVPYVPQPTNQGGNQGPNLRPLAPAGPPNQSSTPPNANLKVEPIQPNSINHMFVPPRPVTPFYTRGTAPPSQSQRMPNQHNRPQQQHMYSSQYMPMTGIPVYHLQNMYFNNGQRPQGGYVLPVQQPFGQPLASYAPYAAHSQTSSMSYYFSPVMSRQGPQPQTAATPPNPIQHPVPNMPMPPAAPPHVPIKQAPKRRSNAIPVIDPSTGLDKLNEIYEDNSHPPSGESSARQTPQPSPHNPSKEVQAMFVKQVIGNDEVNIDDPDHHEPLGDHSEQSAILSQQAVPGSMPFEQVIQTSNLKAHAKEFVSSTITAKETPIVSANCDAVEVTLPNKQAKDRESPNKGRKQRDQTREHRDSMKDSNCSDKQSSLVKDIDSKQKDVSSTVSATSVASHANINKSSKESVTHLREEEKKNHKRDAKMVESKVPSVEATESASLTPAASVQQLQQPSPIQEAAKSKQNAPQRIVQQQQQQSKPQHNQKAAPVPQSQPAKANNKAHKKTELNLKGANKEGTDMDAFNDNANATANTEDAINANLNAANSNKDILNANSVPQQQQQQPVAVPSATAPPQDALNETTNKKTDSNEVVTIKPPEPKVIPKHKIDVTDIVKEKPKPLKSFVQPQAGDGQDEIDRAAVSNDKLVQAKNEANSKVNPAISESNVISEMKSDVMLTYREGQWAPHNPEGKMSYEKDFLLSLRDFPNSKKRPENIPEGFLADERSRMNDSRYSGGRTDVMNLPFSNSYGGKSNSQKAAMASKRPSAKGMIGGKGVKTAPKVSISLKEDVKLSMSENAWRPARNAKEEAATDEERKTDDLYKKVRGVLNKLTPQKFDTLISQVRSLQIDTENRLQGVIDLVFEKAVDEPNFSVAYALMCKELALMQVPTANSTPEKKEFVHFRKLLIGRCQTEFEKQSSDETKRIEMVKEIENCTDPDKKKDLEFELEEYDRKLRMKSVGTIRFIGELYKQNMLTVNIMLRCLNNLLEAKNEESLECLCKLLTTIGKEVESKNVDLSGIFNSMKDIANKKGPKVSSRVRFMLQDVIDLRQSKWVPRRQDSAPKTIDQIQKEAEHEQMSIQAMNSVPITPRKDDRGGSGASSDRKKRNQQGEDGWTVNTRKTSTPFTVQSEKLKNKPPEMDSLSLGSFSTFSTWGKGSNIKNQPPSSANKFAALELDNTEKRQFGGSRSSNKDPYSSKGSSLERSYKSYDGRGSRSGSQHRSNDSSGSSSQRSTPAPIVPVVVPKATQPILPQEKLTEDQLERRLKNNLEEYLNDNSSVEEYDQEIRICVPASYMQRVVTDGYMQVLDRSKSTRLKVGLLFAKLIKSQTLPLDDYCAGLEKLLAQVDDLIIDIPKIFDYVAEIIIHLICEEALSLNRLHGSFNLLISQRHAHKLLAALFKLVVSEKGPNFLQSIWQKSGLRLTDFMSNDQVDSFISANGLEFLNGGATSVGQSQMSYEQIQEKLFKFLSSKTSLDDIFSWITANVGDRVKDPKFIRTLATAVFESSIHKNKLVTETLQSHYKLLHKYVDNNSDYELQCLYALQALIHKMEHPKGLLLSICDQLYEDSAFSQESFITWENSTDVAEQEGKGVALKQLTCFFTSLKEPEEEEEDYGSSEASEDA